MHVYSERTEGVFTTTVTGPQPPTIWSYRNMPDCCAVCQNPWCFNNMGTVYTLDGGFKDFLRLHCHTCGWKFTAYRER